MRHCKMGVITGSRGTVISPRGAFPPNIGRVITPMTMAVRPSPRLAPSLPHQGHRPPPSQQAQTVPGTDKTGP